MRPVVRGFIVAAFVAVCAVALLLVWLNFSTAGLPDVQALRAYALTSAGIAPAGLCTDALPVLPRTELQPLFPVLAAAEGQPDKDLYAREIARTIWCSSEKQLSRELKELRFALQVRRRFSIEDQETIYLNRAWYGNQRRGVSAGSQYFFGVPPSKLDVAQAAMLTGLIRRPSYYSPLRHPDHALARRNTVLETMKAQGSLTAAQAAVAEALPLELKAADKLSSSTNAAPLPPHSASE